MKNRIMKKLYSSLFVIAFVFIGQTNLMASWGNDVLISSQEPKASISMAGRSNGVVFAGVPEDSPALQETISIYMSTDYGATWVLTSPPIVTGLAPITKIKMIRSGLDSIYCFYLAGGVVYSRNVESGTQGVFNTYLSDDFDVCSSSGGSLYLIVDVTGNNDIRRFGSPDGGITWGSSGFVSGNGSTPRVYMSGSSDTLVLNYYGPVNTDLPKSVIRAARYRESGPGILSTVASGFMDVQTNTAVDKKEFASVFDQGNIWFFFTEGSTEQQLKCKVSSDGGASYGPEFTIAGGIGNDHKWFDAEHFVAGFSGGGCAITWYADSLQSGSPDIFTDKIMVASCSRIAPTFFTPGESISEHHPVFSPKEYKPSLIAFPNLASYELGVLWAGMDTTVKVFYDLQSAAPTNIPENESVQFEVNVYPNPSNEMINLKLHSKTDEFQIRFIDMRSSILNKPIKIYHPGGLQNYQLIHGINKSGLYLMEISNSEQRVVKKINILKE